MSVVKGEHCTVYSSLLLGVCVHEHITVHSLSLFINITTATAQNETAISIT